VAPPRRPASASCAGLLPPDPFLGPAMGKVTVYEQRAKLLFELDRAAQRAGQQRTLAQQLTHTAATTGEEVAHLRGLLQVGEVGLLWPCRAPCAQTVSVPVCVCVGIYMYVCARKCAHASKLCAGRGQVRGCVHFCASAAHM